MSKTNDTITVLENLSPKYKNILDMLTVLPEAFVIDVAKRPRKFSPNEFSNVQTLLIRSLTCAIKELESTTLEGVNNYKETMKVNDE